MTPAGRRLALRITCRHRLLEALLVESFDKRRDRVHVEVDRLEHHVSAELEDSSPHGSASRQSTPRGPAAPTEQTGGWPALLANLKTLLETGDALPPTAATTAAPGQAAWGCRRGPGD